MSFYNFEKSFGVDREIVIVGIVIVVILNCGGK